MRSREPWEIQLCRGVRPDADALGGKASSAAASKAAFKCAAWSSGCMLNGGWGTIWRACAKAC
eukprot:1061794-Pyramimonas_sp.AAC.1